MENCQHRVFFTWSTSSPCSALPMQTESGFCLSSSIAMEMNMQTWTLNFKHPEPDVCKPNQIGLIHLNQINWFTYLRFHKGKRNNSNDKNENILKENWCSIIYVKNNYTDKNVLQRKTLKRMKWNQEKCSAKQAWLYNVWMINSSKS